MYIYDNIRTFYFNFFLSNYWIETKYFELVTVTESNPSTWANRLPNINKCENGWSNFSASFSVVTLKLTELIRFALPNQWFSSISFVPLLAKGRHHELSFSLLWAYTYLSLVYITWVAPAHTQAELRCMLDKQLVKWHWNVVKRRSAETWCYFKLTASWSTSHISWCYFMLTASWSIYLSYFVVLLQADS